MRTFRIFWIAGCLASGVIGTAAEKTPPTISKIYDMQLASVEREVLSLADAMPAEKYNFAPTQGEFTGVRTFGQQLKHMSATNFGMAATVLGEKIPVDIGKDESGPDALKTKEEIIRFAKDSFAYMHKAEAVLTSANLTDQMPSAFDAGGGKMARGYAANIPIWHCFDHYGQMVVYARMNGIVPPASRKQ